MNRTDYQDQIKALKKLRNQNNQTNKDKIELKTTLLPIHQDLNAIIRDALNKLKRDTYVNIHTYKHLSTMHSKLSYA